MQPQAQAQGRAQTPAQGSAETRGQADNPAEALEGPQVEVVGTMPLPGLGTPLRDVPANVQVHTSREIGAQRQLNITDFLEQNATSVTVNSAQGNPYQPDVSFRGFTASPLLGLPQGLSVFQDGVRVNESFGDGVNWDLIPQSAIANIQLVPGSNPAFGLNTLGGALAVYTKSGSQYPGGALQVTGGSFGQRAVQAEYGGKRGAWDYFLTANVHNDRGWAEHNPSRVRQFFGKVGYQTGATDLDVSLTAADNTLQGTQTLPLSFLNNIRQAYTYPDTTRNQLTAVTVKGSHFVSDRLLVGGNVYVRKLRSTNTSSNANGDFGAIDPATGLPDTLQATNDRSVIDQQGVGAALQVTLLDDLFGRPNQLSVGVSGDFGDARFTQDEQDAQFDASRAALGIGDYARETDARARNRYYGVFFSDTWSVADRWALSLSGRLNRARVRIDDRSGTAPGLDGDHTFTRFDPAVGVTFNPSRNLTAYGALNSGTRVPTPIELTCADPAAPCRLPNNFLSDPPLKMVRARTAEVGLRGRWAESTAWSAAVFRTDLDDDIQFISSGAGAVNAGFFQNVGRTRRQGIELAASHRSGPFAVSVRYSFLDATFQSTFQENSPHNSSADANGAITVRSGNRIPAIPRHSLRVRLDWQAAERLALGANAIVSGNTFARGDENNQDAGGKVPGYAVFNFDARYALAAGFELFARINNVFDARYANFGVLGQNFFTGPGQTFDGANAVNEQFRGVGAPRGAWLGVRYAWK